MNTPHQTAAAILAGFNKHYTLFRAKSAAAKALFDAGELNRLQIQAA